MDRLQHLRVLDVSGNALTSLPPQLWSLPRLSRVIAHGNALDADTLQQARAVHRVRVELDGTACGACARDV